MKLTPRFEESLCYAVRLHADQTRKGTQIPYAAHLLSVAALVIENGGDEDQAIAALLHDAVEDQGGLPRLQEIRQRYGERVANLVDGCTDAYQLPKPPWRQRKEAYLDRLRKEHPDVRLISLADKLHNARSLFISLKEEGQAVWKRFNGGKDGTLWYYQALLQVFLEISPGAMTDEFQRLVAAIQQISE